MWGPVAIGWLVAVVSFIVIGLIFGALGLIVTEPPGPTGAITAGTFISSMLVGFLAHGIGGYVAGRRAGVNPILNGVMVAVLGLAIVVVLTIIFGIFGGLFFEGQGALTVPGFLGYAGAGFVTVLINFLFNALGGYVGGRVAGNQAASSGSGSSSSSSRVR
jgi:hypothetical protein